VTSPFGPLVLIVDRTSADVAETTLRQVQPKLTELDLEFRAVFAEQPGQAAVVARDALRGGERFLVAVGGDAVVHHVVQGMIEDDRAVDPDAVLGVIPGHSGSDFLRTFGVPMDAVRACAHLLGTNLYPIDVGRVECRVDGGRGLVEYFVNVAEVGLGGAIVSRTEGLPGWLGRSRRLLGFWLALSRSAPTRVTLRSGERTIEETSHNVVVANGQYMGGGSRISPRSWPDDGLFELQVFTGPRSDAFTLLPAMFRGEHLPHKNIVELKTRGFDIRTESPRPIAADGKLVGTTPARFDVIRTPIRLKI
jgi:diacylglycerol kinase (ATP)